MERSGKRQGRGARRQRRGQRGPAQHRPAPVPVTEEGVPAAIPDAPVASPAVFTTEATRARFPWVPARVIAGSVWRGPGHVKVKVDANGEATIWPRPPP